MKKLTALLLVTALLLCSFSLPVSAASVVRTDQSLSVNERIVNCDVYNIDGSNYFKLRDLAYLLNGTGSQFAVGYNDAARTISVTTGVAYTPLGNELLIGDDLSETAQSSTQPLYVNGSLYSSLSAYNIGGNNFFKLRDLGAVLGFSVDYDETSRTMLVKSTGVTPKQVLTAEEIYAKCVSAVFLIEVYDSRGLFATGSGFFIDADGTAVTNYHVIDGATSAEITVNAPGGAAKYSVLGVYDYNIAEDWAILKIQGSGFSCLSVGDATSVMGGATVYAMGSPLGLDSTFSQGLISNPSRIVDGQSYIQTTAAISHGSSGGALLNKYGEVIGITSATFEDGQNLNLAIPVSKLPAVDKSSYVTLDSIAADVSAGYIAPLYYEDYEVTVRQGQTVGIELIAYAYDRNETYYIHVSADNEGLLGFSFSSWHSSDGITLYITGKAPGTTYVDLELRSYTTDALLATDYIEVTVVN